MSLEDFNAISTLFLKLGGIQCLKPTNRNTHKLLKTPYFSDLVMDAPCSWHFGLNTDLPALSSAPGSRETEMRLTRPGGCGSRPLSPVMSTGKLWEIITNTLRLGLMLIQRLYEFDKFDTNIVRLIDQSLVRLGTVKY